MGKCGELTPATRQVPACSILMCTHTIYEKVLCYVWNHDASFFACVSHGSLGSHVCSCSSGTFSTLSASRAHPGGLPGCQQRGRSLLRPERQRVGRMASHRRSSHWVGIVDGRSFVGRRWKGCGKPNAAACAALWLCRSSSCSSRAARSQEARDKWKCKSLDVALHWR